MLEHLGSFKLPGGLLLKRMCLIFLYNLSICKRGAILIQMSKNGIANILKCLGSENTIEIQTLALTLIIAMLNEIPTKEFCQQVMKNVSRGNFIEVLWQWVDREILVWWQALDTLNQRQCTILFLLLSFVSQKSEKVRKGDGHQKDFKFGWLERNFASILSFQTVTSTFKKVLKCNSSHSGFHLLGFFFQ